MKQAGPDPVATSVLSDAEMERLRAWNPDFLRLTIHSEIEHQMRIGMDGVESTVLVALRGTGKSFSIQTLARAIESQEADRAMAEPGYDPRRIVVYETSSARGNRTALIDLYEEVAGRLSISARRTHTARSLVEQIAEELKAQAIHLVCIDEAQKIDAKNLDELRQVADKTATIGHPFAFMLAGSEELRETCVEIKQLGQRFSTELRMPSITPAGLSPYLAEVHPHLPPLKKAMKKEWASLERDLFQAAGGKFRRLQRILANANALAIKCRCPIDEVLLRTAIAKIASEV